MAQRSIPARGDAVPLFTDMSAPRRVWEGVGGPLVAGALTGVALGLSAVAYVVVVLVSFLGGIPAGAQHRTLRGALLRACAAGALWALALLGAFHLLHSEARVALPEPEVLMLAFGVVPSCLVAAVVWSLTRRRSRG
ncbi:hypothetical protein [Actinokineospora bangkokensis]|uniref:Integral membrane protein n=1 Tax=Actinokineospora bangkokensis TaxID=1193682 RepID=A0A1Q9LM23_9PSEU|nr:hypothetical protein [Actinokineospora bangkokensis]OLR93082.1 hypothetical protein BJP25_19230 [Actinokineospora bangkokensis]